MSSSGVTPPNYEVRPEVHHGANANTARPATSAVVTWFGTVRPLNAAAQDVFWNEQADLPERYDGAAWHVQGAATYVAAFFPEAYGAVGNGSTDDTTAVQAAITAAQAVHGVVYLASVYKITTVTASAAVTIRGVGGIYGGNTTTQPSAVCGFTTSSATADALVITSTGVHLENFAVLNTATTPSAGAGIHVSSGGSYCTMEQLYVLGFYDNVKVEAGRYYTLRTVHSYDPIRYGFYLLSTLGAVDTGDAVIDGCVADSIYTTRNGTAGLRWEGGGGPKVTNCKVNGFSGGANGRFTNGLDFAIMDGGSTSDILIAGNSIENNTNAGILIEQAGPSNTGTLSNITITGNEIGSGTRAYGIYVFANNIGDISNVTITGNVVLGCTTGGVYTNALKHATISGNVLGMSGTPGDAIHVSQGWGVTVAPNVIEPPTSFSQGMVTLTGSASQNVRLDRQNFASTNSVALVNCTYWNSGATNTQFGFIDMNDGRVLPAVTSTSTWVQLFSVVLPSSGGGSVSLDLRINGVAAGASVPFSIAATRLAERPTAGGACTLTTVGTDVNTQATQVDYQFDTATTAGLVIVSVRLHSGGTSTGLSGTCSLKATGQVYQFIRS